MLEVEFLSDGVRFYNYPYPPASVYPNGTIAYEQIAEVEPIFGHIRTKDREILFVAARFRESLQTIAAEHNIPIVSRHDVWSLILEPFLDTEFDDEQKERTLQILEECGVSREEVQSWRSSLQFCMYNYNFVSGLWEWGYLGLTDVLDARLGKLSGFCCRLSRRKYREFYFQAMELAFRGKRL